MRECSRPTCSSKHYALGVCLAHYREQRRYGGFICAGKDCDEPVDTLQLLCETCTARLRLRVQLAMTS